MVLKFDLMRFTLARQNRILIVLSILSISSFSFNPTERDWNKIEKSIKQVFDISDCNFSQLIMENNNNKDIYFAISSNEQIVGYLVTGQANSKHRQFDFYILYSKNAIILKVEVLTYREDYGFEMCNIKWLQQFIGLDTENEFEYNSRVDGISGATISVNSIKHKVFTLSNKLKNNIKTL